MKRLRLLLPGFFVWTAFASAQQPGLYDGKWSATFKSQSGLSDHGELVLSGQGGTWKFISIHGHQMSRYPCVDRELPVTVRSSSPEELTFAIEASKAVAGCTDRSVAVKRVDDKTLEGHFLEGGTALHLSRP